MTVESKNVGKPDRRPENVWLTLDNFQLEGKCVARRRGQGERIVAQWRMPARAGLRVIGMLAQQLLMCWASIVRQNVKIAVRWLFWRA